MRNLAKPRAELTTSALLDSVSAFEASAEVTATLVAQVSSPDMNLETLTRVGCGVPVRMDQMAFAPERFYG